METAAIASRGFEDSPVDAVLERPVAQGAATALIFLEVALEALGEDVGVEPRLTDIDADDYDGGGLAHSCVPVLLRFGATPTLQLRSLRN